MKLTIYSDITNPFGFSGSEGYGAGMHGRSDFLSSEYLGKMVEIINKTSFLTYYQRYSPEGHFSCFYGNIVFRNVDGTRDCYLDPSFSHYGINLDTSSFLTNDIFDADTSMFQVPLSDELLFDNYDPIIKFSCFYQSDVMKQYRPFLDSFDYTNGKVINFYLRDIYTGDVFTTSDYSALTDRDLQMFMFGIKTIPDSIL